MKILDICSSIPSQGIHYYAAMISQGFHRFGGAEVRIVSSPGEADQGVRSRLKMDEIKVVDFPWPEERGFVNTLKSATFLSKIIQDFQPDVIHTWGLPHSLRVWLAIKQTNIKKVIPIVTTLSSIRHGKVEEWPARIIAAQILNFLPGKVCVQCSSEKFKMIKAGMFKNELRITFLFVDSELFADDVNEKVDEFKEEYGLNKRIGIVYLAQFIPRKGHLYLLEAAKKIVNQHPECIFIMAGDGPLLDYTRHKADFMGLSNFVAFPGRIPINDVPSLLRSCKIGVVSSLSETFGSAIVEPLSVGLPVVTTDVGIAWDLANIGGVSMAPPRNSMELARALIKYIENPQIAKKEAGKGREFLLTNCNFETVVRNYLKVFQECLR